MTYKHHVLVLVAYQSVKDDPHALISPDPQKLLDPLESVRSG